jgi:hypothetical protein
MCAVCIDWITVILVNLTWVRFDFAALAVMRSALAGDVIYDCSTLAFPVADMLVAVSTVLTWCRSTLIHVDGAITVSSVEPRICRKPDCASVSVVIHDLQICTGSRGVSVLAGAPVAAQCERIVAG